MDRLVRVLGERRRLWPPDESSSIACIGLLGWMQTTYLRPDRMEQATKGWMWLGGLLESASKTPRIRQSTKAFNAGDQRAIDAYAAAVARHALRVDDPSQAEWPDASHAGEWLPQDIELLMALGARHGEVVREMLVGVWANFESWRRHDLPTFAARHASRPDDKPMEDEHDPGLGSLLKQFQIRDTTLFKDD